MASIKLKGDTSGEVTISAPAVAGTTTLELPATSSTLATQNALGVRNLIINGDMRIDQRNATVTTSNYTVDRFKYFSTQASKASLNQSSDAPNNFNNSLLTTSSSAYSILSSDVINIVQYLEGYNIAHLGWGTANAKTVTLSFYVKSSLTGTFGGAILNYAGNRSYPFEYTIDATNTWERKTITITGDTGGTWVGASNAGAMIVSLSLGTGSTYSGTANLWSGNQFYSATGATSVVGTSGATFYITGVQLEVGDTATPFEHRPYDMELARCQRYYWKQIADTTARYSTGVQADNTTTCYATVTIPQVLRATPSLDWSDLVLRYGATNISISSSIIINRFLDNMNAVNLRITTTGLGAANVYQLRSDSATAYLEFSSEL